ncbi:hypothetical protein PcaKH15_21610 [Parageobacillus caldoxylosilyticus]|nr:hypothetical protein PcaKH15_21610 [Parageobacillus caldoxylosilyticus]
MATWGFSHRNGTADDMDGKTGRNNRMVCPQLRLETLIFVCWVFAVYGDSLEVLSLDELALEAMDIKKDCRIFAGNITEQTFHY